jgi:hypothetical protein
MRRKCIMVFTFNIILEYQAWLGLAEMPLYEFDSLDIGGEKRIQRLKEPRGFFSACETIQSII